MKKLSLAKLISGLGARSSEGPSWHPAPPYPRLAGIAPVAKDIVGAEGLYVLWHLGVRPRWLRVGATANLGQSLLHLATMPWVELHARNGGVLAAWMIAPPGPAAGMTRFLAETLKPAYQDEPFPLDRTLDADTAAIVCPLPPGLSR